MTEAADAKPGQGWYVAYDNYAKLRVLRCFEDGFRFKGYDDGPIQAGWSLPPGWTLGPNIADLLRDTEWLDWLLKSHGVMRAVCHNVAVSPNTWLLEKTPQEKRTLIDAEMARERKPEGGE